MSSHVSRFKAKTHFFFILFFLPFSIFFSSKLPSFLTTFFSLCIFLFFLNIFKKDKRTHERIIILIFMRVRKSSPSHHQLLAFSHSASASSAFPKKIWPKMEQMPCSFFHSAKYWNDVMMMEEVFLVFFWNDHHLYNKSLFCVYKPVRVMSVIEWVKNNKQQISLFYSREFTLDDDLFKTQATA